ncbi:hypothetical protein EKQ61_04465 [Staphylococcus gallinarum]|uniref:Membrane protein n=1 Tax=Staphylococcus gallinarum TaxID=1293 RepID=A0A0D0QYK3_STAGA|nr:hypothetical protein [Staphylococcus gallinarum]KIR12246.1 hypothetical protein SH09_03595 [Staphylococcus gallinarum]RTX80314.1 hypothetical protein EKQ61_04465 [Staphylococcus gallinarum]GEQ06610.1 hypothetical protein SGA02_24380 [Staphylococcus gallinarum]SUQ38591.1 membrane protein [Staphylococcus gallinarum]
MNLIPFIVILIFSYLWTALTNKYLPSETLDKKGQQDRYDERQRKMFIEILAKSFIWIIYCMLFTLLIRLIGLTPNIEKTWFSQYPEIFFIVAAIYLWLLITLLQIKKYTSKG